MADAPLTLGQAADWLGQNGYGRDASLDSVVPATAEREHVIQLMAYRHPETAAVAYIYGDDFDAPLVKLPGQEPAHLTAESEITA